MHFWHFASNTTTRRKFSYTDIYIYTHGKRSTYMQFIWFMMMFSDNMYPWKSQWLILPPTKMTFREFINSSSYGSHAAWHFLTMAHMNGPTHGNAINMFEKWLKGKLAVFFSTPVRANYIYISLNPSLSHHFQTILYPKPPKLFSHFYAIISIIIHSIFNFSLCFFHPSKICPPFLAKGRPSEMRSSPPGVKLSPIFFRAGRPDFSHENRDLLGNTLGNLGNYSWCILVLFKILTSDIENWGWLNEQNIWI